MAHPKVARWLDRYPPGPETDATFDRKTRAWTVHVWTDDAGEVAKGVVRDLDGTVSEAWTGPQVAWKMARGRPGAFGGKLLTSWPVWLGLSAVFLLGLVDLRRPLTLVNLDLLLLLSFGASLAFFNRGEVFQSAALAVPPLVYFLVRTAWIGFRSASRPRAAHPRWPVWVLAAATLFLVGFRVGLNIDQGRTVIDVGYAGVIGADRILDGRAPYGAMPVTDDRTRAALPAPTGRSGNGSSRTAVASRQTPAVTRTGLSPISHTSLPSSSSGGAAGGTTYPRRTRRRSPSTCSCSAGSRSSADASAEPVSPRRSRSRGPPSRSRPTRSCRTRTTRSCPPCSCGASGSRRHRWRAAPPPRSPPGRSSRP